MHFIAVHAGGEKSKRDFPCPCDDAKLCRPVDRVVEREVYGFGVSMDPEVYAKYDWNKLTTVSSTEEP